MNRPHLAWGIGAALVACASAPPPRPLPVAASTNLPPSRNLETERARSVADPSRALGSTRRGVMAMRWDVQRQLTHARMRGDRAEASCLDEQLSQLDALLRLLDEQRTNASTADDETSRRRSFQRVTVLRERALEVGEEARRCAAGVVTEGAVTTVVLRAP